MAFLESAEQFYQYITLIRLTQHFIWYKNFAYLLKLSYSN